MQACNDLQEAEKFGGWILTILRHTALDFLRSKKEGVSLETLQEDGFEPEDGTRLDPQVDGGLNGVRWSALIGYGSGTLGQIREYTGLCLTWWWYQPCPKRDEIPVDGDGTVAVLSATRRYALRKTVKFSCAVPTS